jgi:hypothetical protein
MAVAPERLRGDLFRLLHRGPGLRDFTHEAARAIARAVPFDGVCLLALDPATLLPTSEVVENGLPPEVGARLAELETRGLDFNHFTVLARSERRAATLVDATEAISNAAAGTTSSGTRPGSATSCARRSSRTTPRGAG